MRAFGYTTTRIAQFAILYQFILKNSAMTIRCSIAWFACSTSSYVRGSWTLQLTLWLHSTLLALNTSRMGTHKDGKVQALFLPDTRQRYFDSDRVSCMANLAHLTVEEKKEMAAAYKLNKEEFNAQPVVQRLFWFIRIEKPCFESRIDPKHLQHPVFVKPKMSNRRIIAQSAVFLIYGARRLASKEVDTDLRLLRAIVPAEKKEEIRAELERLGIHASSLFPEIDKAAGWIVTRYTNVRN